MHLASTPALQRIAASHVLRIGTTGDYAPFSVESRGTLCGADIELALDLARQLGSRPLFVRTSWPTLLSDLRRDEFDVAIGGISATAARGAVAGLTIPYLSVGKTIITRCAVARRLGSLAALDQPGVRVVVNPGGTNEQFARSHLHRAQLRLYKDNLSIFDELIAGRADAMITDDVEVELETHRHRELCRSFPGTLTRADKVILTARDAALTAAVNAWLGKELAAGVVDRLLREGAGTCDAEATAAGRAAR